MPTTSSTTSFVAGGGDDLGNDNRLAFAPTLAASPSSSPTLNSIYAPSRGTPHPTVSSGADGLGAPSALSAHLGAVGPVLVHRNALTTCSPTSAAHFGSDGAWAFIGFIWHPRPPFPTVELARRGSHAPIANAPLPVPPPLSTTRPARPRCVLQIKPRVGFFWGYLAGFCVIPPLPTHRSAAFGARGNYPRWAHPASPWLKLLCPSLDLTVADWLFYRASKSFTKGRHANFQLELITTMDVSKPFTSEFLLQTARCLDSAKADSNVWEEFLFNLTYRALEDRDYLRIDLIFVTRHSSKVEQLYTIRWSFVQYYMRLQYLNAKAMLVRSQVTWTLAFVDWQVIQRRSHSLLSRLEIHTLYRRVSSCQVLIHACFKPSWRKEFTYINNLFTLQLIVNRPLKFSRSLHQDAGHHSTPSMMSPPLSAYEITELQFELNTSPLSVLAFEAEAIRLTVSNPHQLEHGRTRGTEAASLETIHPRRIQVEEFLEGDSEVLYIFVLAGAEPRSCERLVSWDDTKVRTHSDSKTGISTYLPQFRPDSLETTLRLGPHTHRTVPATSPRSQGMPCRRYSGRSKTLGAAVSHLYEHVTLSYERGTSPPRQVRASRALSINPPDSRLSDAPFRSPSNISDTPKKTLISTYLLQFRTGSLGPTLRIVVQTYRIVRGPSRRVGAGASNTNPGASRLPGAQRIDATNTASKMVNSTHLLEICIDSDRAAFGVGVEMEYNVPAADLQRRGAISGRPDSDSRSMLSEGLRRPRAEYSVCERYMPAVRRSRLRDVCVVTRFAASGHGLGMARANGTVQRVCGAESGGARLVRVVM
ncbi:hypothetical protein C8R43DRAFT_1130971 [Mycena crocata]|nr:hypothetical protein C8R43DRAFT_1130971 [Mycena crocata]